MPIKYYPDMIQGSDEWLEVRRGLLTASEMHLIVTPTLKAASNEKERIHLFELMAQRITGYVEPQYVSDAMLRGQEDEIYARAIYAEKYGPVQEVGFITNDNFGFTLGYSPDGLVGDKGAIEIKSRSQKYQMQTILEWAVPSDYIIQVQTGLLVSRREWCDYISYCGGMPMATIRMHADSKIQDAIVETSAKFEARIKQMMLVWASRLDDGQHRLVPTERRIQQEIVV